LPNIRVQAKAAIWGAAVAALVWSLAKWGFGACIIKFVPYGKVYGVLGIIPLSVFWIYLSWLIVLFGLQLTFTTQHLKSLDAAEIAASRRTEEYFIADDFTVINIVREIAAAFEADKAPVSSAVICSKLDIPAEFGDKIFDHLVNSGIILKSSEPRTGFMPAKDPANIKLSEISEAVAAAGFGRPTTESAGALEQITQTQRDALAQYNIKQILG
jgi:membrane protein